LLTRLNRSWKETANDLELYVQKNVGKKKKLSKFSLCFHGGPDPARTGALLDLFKKKKIKASFFVEPERAKRYPQLVRRMIKEGHQVGAMGWGDIGVTAYGRKMMPDAEKSHRDILRTQELIVSTLGPRTSMEVHFPSSHALADSSAIKGDLAKQLRRSGLRIHPEHLEAHDWKYRNPTELFQSIHSTLKENSVSSERFPVSLAFSDQFEQSLIVIEKLLQVGKPVSPIRGIEKNSKHKMASNRSL
jgi:peptidoglycan/xylan/chitin deacetylase (PgdA/CDA1 family)